MDHLRSLVNQLRLFVLRWLEGTMAARPERTPNNTIQSDHPLFTNHITFEDLTTTFARYPSIRRFYHPHAHAGKLKQFADLPLLVIIHGLGGSLPQFTPLLGSLINLAPAFGLELPGHGMSEFAPKTYEAYSFEALVELWKVGIEDVCHRNGHRKVVLIAHSLGCSIAAALTSTSSLVRLEIEVLGVVAICPKASPPTQSQVVQYRRLLSLPDCVLDLLRWFDRRGGENSSSVKRFVGETAGVDLKQLQLRFNQEFKTPVWKRTSIGLLPQYQKGKAPVGGIAGRTTWEAVRAPLLMITGELDRVTKPAEATEIAAFIQGKPAPDRTQDQPMPLANSIERKVDACANDKLYGVKPSSIDAKSQHLAPLKLVLLPAPASHALMYDHSFYRTVAGLIEDFLATHVLHELSLGWQLQQLTTSGKWDVKNLQKWKKVLPVSGPIDGGRFRALKTLREQDEEHTPIAFLQNWSKKIFAIIDISHDSPVYDTHAIEKGGIQYHKFPTVSKVPPTPTEVQDFIALVTRLRGEIEEKFPDGVEQPAIAVHCHYGYNRTGFFIVCYLIEKRGYKVQDAIEEFAQAKPPGIRHDHFVDTLFVRYTVGLRRGSTFK